MERAVFTLWNYRVLAAKEKSDEIALRSKRQAAAEGTRIGKEKAVDGENLAAVGQPSVLAPSTVLLMRVFLDLYYICSAVFCTNKNKFSVTDSATLEGI